MIVIRRIKRAAWTVLLFGALVIGLGPEAQAKIDGVTGTNFTFVAGEGNMITSDGDSFLIWGFDGTPDPGVAVGVQYPGPTLILNEGDVVTIQVRNDLPAQAGNLAVVFHGLGTTAAGGVPGMLTREAPPDGVTLVTYTVTASRPGTYLYRAGTPLQVEMGLVGVIVVRPTGQPTWAYDHADTEFDREFLLLITEMDPRIHRFVEFGRYDRIDFSTYFATNWFINGRNFPDLMAESYVAWLPNQPYNFQPRMHPGDKVLVRSVGGGFDLHPFHYHGNDVEVIAVDGRMLSTDPDGGSTGPGPDLAWKATTRRVVPGQTADVMWTWTGEKIGWDIYGEIDATCTDPDNDGFDDSTGLFCHDANCEDTNPADGFDDATWEYCADHGVAFPVIIPPKESLSFGQFYAGSPFLGKGGDLPVGHPSANQFGGFFYMWHSHTEKELTSNDIWPGGLVSFMIVEPPFVNIVE